jgi:hypothetical protein
MEFIYKGDEKRKESNKLYYEKNKEKSREYYLKNKEKQKLNRQKNKDNDNFNRRNRKKIDSLYKLKCNTRALIAVSISKKGYTKKSRTFEILGCTIEDFKQHLERQFLKGMSWDNRSEWHLDHIYPISLAKDEHEVIKLNHYTNFQPLWAKDNLEKNNKIIHNTQIKLI